MEERPCLPPAPPASPPPPHDPRDRVLVDTVGDWEVRCFAPGDPKFHYFVTRRLLHVQLWHPAARVSVLTPSRLTAGLFEAFPHEGWKARVRCPDALAAMVERDHGLALPALPRLAALVSWHVRAAERRATRTPPLPGIGARPCAAPIAAGWPAQGTPAAQSSPPRSARARD